MRPLPVQGLAMAALAALAAAAGAHAQVARSTPGQPEARTAVELMPTPVRLSVTTPAFADGGDIPFENTQYCGNVFPGLSWTPGPAATKAYVLIMQDNSLLYHGAPILHWTMINIPAGVTRLAPGMTDPPAGAGYGPNYKGQAQPYAGPRTPPGPGDRYHFEIFALDSLVPDPGPNYKALTTAMAGHILASGEVVGVGHRDPSAP